MAAYTEPAQPTIFHCRQDAPNPVSIGSTEELISGASLARTIFRNFGGTVGAVHYKALETNPNK